MYSFRRLGKEVYDIKIGDTLKIVYYFIPLNIGVLLWNAVYSFMKMNIIHEIMVMFGRRIIFQILSGFNVKEK